MQVGALFKHWSLRLLAPDRVLQRSYDAFKELLAWDGRCHVLMAEFAALAQDDRREDCARTRIRHRQLVEAVLGMITALEQLHPAVADGLREYAGKYDFYLQLLLAPPERFLIPPFVVNHTAPVEAALVGNKSFRLLQLKQEIAAPVPDGFTLTSTTFALLVDHNGVRPAMDLLLAAIDPEDDQGLARISQALTTLVLHLHIPPQVEAEILAAYDGLPRTKASPLVAVRSSAQQEDGSYSFAGQYHSVLGVDREGLFDAYREVLASKYTPQALLYRIHAGLADEEAAMAVLVLVMVDAQASGVVYTRSPLDATDTSLQVHSIHGLGLPLVGGEVIPQVHVFPPESLESVTVQPGEQQRHLVLRSGRVVEEDCPPGPPPLGEELLRHLVSTARRIEAHFGEPQDIEWAVDGDGQLVILQARPLGIVEQAITPVTSSVPQTPLDAIALLSGAIPASPGVVSGSLLYLEDFNAAMINNKGILVTHHIPPSLVRHIDRLAGVICEQGSVTGHFATVCREFGVVLLVGARDALRLLPSGREVTVDGRAGVVYDGVVGELLRQQTQPVGHRHTQYAERVGKLLSHITPLHLVDPQSRDFRPQSCRSLHDIIRYAHEMAVRAMFGLGEVTGGASGRSRKLATELPLSIYLLDVGGAFLEEGKEAIKPQQLDAPPLLALWQGLSHPEIDWHSHLHFDWQGFGDMALSGGIAGGNDSQFASYAVISPDYLNLNMRFGFHFTLIDCLCAAESRANHCQLRFAGGGGGSDGKAMRLQLLHRILTRLGFEVQVQGDLLDARLSGWPRAELLATLVDVGRLLGMTKLLDMVLREDEIDQRVEQFFTPRISDHQPSA